MSVIFFFTPPTTVLYIKVDTVQEPSLLNVLLDSEPPPSSILQPINFKNFENLHSLASDWLEPVPQEVSKIDLLHASVQKSLR